MLALAVTGVGMAACHSPTAPSSGATAVQITSPVTGAGITQVLPPDGTYNYTFAVQFPSTCARMAFTYPNGITFDSTLTVAGATLRFFVPDSRLQNPDGQGVDIELTRSNNQLTGVVAGSTGIDYSGRGGSGSSPSITFWGGSGDHTAVGLLSGVWNSQGQMDGTLNGAVDRDTIGLTYITCEDAGITWTLTPR